MRRNKKWLLIIIGLWIGGLTISLLSVANVLSNGWLELIGTTIVTAGIFFLGLSIFIYARSIVDWSTSWYVKRDIKYWRGVLVESPGWNQFSVWLYRIVGIALMTPIIFYLLRKLINFVFAL